MTVIGLTGLKGSGKDTAAAALCEPSPMGGRPFRRLALADPLRQMLYTLNPIVRAGDPPKTPAFRTTEGVVRWRDLMDDLGYDQAKQDPEVRRLMQVFGTEVMRQQFDDHVWIDLAARTIQADPSQDWVVTDVRFDNEAEMIHTLGGHVVQIVRDGLVADGHASEEGVNIDLVDLRVPNNTTVEDLHRQIRAVVRVVGQLRRVE